MKIKKLVVSVLLLAAIIFSSIGLVAASEEPDPIRPKSISVEYSLWEK